MSDDPRRDPTAGTDRPDPDGGGTADDAPYRPIDCGVHDVLEASAVLRRPCRIGFRRSDGAVEEVRAVIADVYAHEGAEYVRLETGLVIRLDRLITVEPETGGA